MAYNNNFNNGNGNNNYSNNRPRTMGGNYTPRSGYTPKNTAPASTGRGKDTDITTSGVTLYNERTSRFLNIDFWNKACTLSIGICPAGMPMDWDNRKNAQRFNQCVTFTDLCDIECICEEVIDSIKTTGTFTSTAVKVGAKQDSIVEISNGSNIGMGPGIYLVLYKNVDESGRTNTMEYYQFSDTKTLRGYDHTTGVSKEDLSKIGNFKKFYKCIREGSKAFTMAMAHTVSVNQKGDKLSIMKSLSALTAKMGIDMNAELTSIIGKPAAYKSNNNSNGGNYNRGYNNNYNRYNNKPNNNYTPNRGQQPSYQQQSNILASMDEPVDINLTMSTLSNVDVSQFS